MAVVAAGAARSAVAVTASSAASRACDRVQNLSGPDRVLVALCGCGSASPARCRSCPGSHCAVPAEVAAVAVALADCASAGSTCAAAARSASSWTHPCATARLCVAAAVWSDQDPGPVQDSCAGCSAAATGFLRVADREPSALACAVRALASDRFSAACSARTAPGQQCRTHRGAALDPARAASFAVACAGSVWFATLGALAASWAVQNPVLVADPVAVRASEVDRGLV